MHIPVHAGASLFLCSAIALNRKRIRFNGLNFLLFGRYVKTKETGGKMLLKTKSAEQSVKGRNKHQRQKATFEFQEKCNILKND